MPMYFSVFAGIIQLSLRNRGAGHLLPFAPLSASVGNCPLCPPPAPPPMPVTVVCTYSWQKQTSVSKSVRSLPRRDDVTYV